MVVQGEAMGKGEKMTYCHRTMLVFCCSFAITTILGLLVPLASAYIAFFFFFYKAILRIQVHSSPLILVRF